MQSSPSKLLILVHQKHTHLRQYRIYFLHIGANPTLSRINGGHILLTIGAEALQGQQLLPHFALGYLPP